MNKPHALKRIRNHTAFMYGIRLFFAFAGTAFVPYFLQQQPLTIPLSLGVIAAALSDIDDRFSLMLRNLFFTYVGFFITASLVQVFFPYPILFGLLLIIMCVGLILLGSLGQRYAKISFGCLVVSVYAMLGADVFPHWYQQPLLLVAGAMWYGFLSTLSFLLFPIKVLQQHLEQCFYQLSQFLFIKSHVFDVDMNAESYQQTVIDLSLANAQISEAFTNTRLALVTRLKSDRGHRDTREALHYYFIAQDIHERTNSAHIDYQKLAKVFQHRDILFRFQRILSLQSKACRDLAYAIHYQQHYVHDIKFKRIFTNLQHSLQQLSLEQQHDPNRYDTVKLNALHALARNLQEIDAQFEHIATQSLQKSKQQHAQALQKVLPKNQSNHNLSLADSLINDDLTGWQDIRQRIRKNFSPESILFRHAIRLSSLLVLAHFVVQLFELEHGYWILMTILFVCQPNFNATKRRAKLRVYGTLAGIALGSFIVYFVPSHIGLLWISIVCGILFLELRAQQFAQATMFITMMALINFHFVSPDDIIALPKISYTLIGCALAWLGLMYIWPDWQFRRLPALIEKNLRSQCEYFAEIILHYQHGRNQNLPYRVVRSQANRLDADLASLISTLATEPDVDEDYKKNAFKFLCLSHTLLGYIAALGAHRDQIEDQEVLAILKQTFEDLQNALLYDKHPILPVQQSQQLLQQRLQHNAVLTEQASAILQQSNLILHLLPELWQLKQNLSFEPHQQHEFA